MDFWKLQKIRASALHDLAEFVPEDHYTNTAYGIEQGAADRMIGSLFFKTNPAMTARQVAACGVLNFTGLYAAADGAIADTQAAREIIMNGSPEPELAATINQPLIYRKSFELDLYNALKEYVKYLPDNEAKPILSYLEGDITQPQAENVGMVNESELQTEAVENLDDTVTKIVSPSTQRKRGNTPINIFLEKLCKEKDIDSLSAQSLVSAIKIFVDTKNDTEQKNCPVKKHHGWYKGVSVEWKPGTGSPQGSWGKKSFSNYVSDYKKKQREISVKH